MRIACLMPTFGRRPELLNNSLACFMSQTHEDKVLIIVDDLGNLQDCKVPDNVKVLSSNRRAPSVGSKYNTAMHFLEGQYTAALVWDDDDVYLPEYISSHVQVLERNEWSKPSSIITAYTNPPSREDAAGRFHGTLGIRRELLHYVNYWEVTRRGTFDQEFIAKLTSAAKAGDPIQYAPPQYVYRWSTAQCMHSSGMIDGDNYFKYKPQYTDPITSLTPEYDDDTKRIITYIENTVL
jgi:glycosyltransferase involved in cell wall biosynthesis